MPDPRVNLFADLLGEWNQFAASRGGAKCLRRWSAAEPVLAPIPDLRTLLAAMQESPDFEHRDALMLAMLRLSRTDTDARQVVLRAIRPGLIALAGLYGRRWEYEDTASTIVLLALERIASYPLHRTTRTAANLIRDVQYRLHRMRVREEATTEAIDRYARGDQATRSSLRRDARPGEEVLSLVGDAVSARLLSEREARLILLRRLLDIPTSAVARAEGRKETAIRKARERAEARLASVRDRLSLAG